MREALAARREIVCLLMAMVLDILLLLLLLLLDEDGLLLDGLLFELLDGLLLDGLLLLIGFETAGDATNLLAAPPALLFLLLFLFALFLLFFLLLLFLPFFFLALAVRFNGLDFLRVRNNIVVVDGEESESFSPAALLFAVPSAATT